MMKSNPPNGGAAGQVIADKILELLPGDPGRTMVVIEGAYIDRRDADIAQLRWQQYRDAEEALRVMTAQGIYKGVIGVTLLNDFADHACGIDSCVEGAVEDKIKRASDALGQYMPPPEFGKVFGMRYARRKALKRIKELMDHSDSRLVMEASEPDMSLVYLLAEDEQVLIACKRKDWRMSARCTSILGWHYHELFCHAIKNNADLESVVVMDFLNPLESTRARLAAVAAFGLFDWTVEASRLVCNCVYLPNGLKLQATAE